MPVADVFLSYRNTPDRRAMVARLASFLRQHEITVWWDRQLEAGRDYRTQLVSEIGAAKVVVPLWCFESVTSDWVLVEAKLGHSRLLPARLQSVKPPEPFDVVHSCNLIGWDGTPAWPGFAEFVDTLSEHLKRKVKGRTELLEHFAHLPPLPQLPTERDLSERSAESILLTELRTAWLKLQATARRPEAQAFLDHLGDVAPGSGLEFEVELWLTDAEQHSDIAHRGLVRSAPSQVRAGDEFRPRDDMPLMVALPAGRFLMGSPATEAGRSQNEGPQREITIAPGTSISKFPVTVGEWRTFLAATNHTAKGDASIWTGSAWKPTPGAGWFDCGFPQTELHPVTCISWEDAQHYIAWISSTTGWAFRLPTEAEWEYACRAGSTQAFAFGEDLGPHLANFGCNEGGTTPVGRYSANRFGLHDMHGLVWEWCQDSLKEHPHPAGPDGHPGNKRADREGIVRGGSWFDSAVCLRSAFRGSMARDSRISYIGFRLACEISGNS